MNRSKKLVIWVVVLVLLCGSLFAVTYYNDNKKEEEIPVKEEAIMISEIAKEDITKIALKNNNGEFDFVKVDENEWSITGYEDYEMKTYLVSNFESMFTSLRADRLIEEIGDETDLSKYGLADPFATIKATLVDGTAKTLSIGNKTPEGYAYYAMMEEDPTVYTVSNNYGRFASYDISDLRDDKVVNVDPTALAYLYIDLKDHDTIEITLEDNPDTYSTHKMIQPYNEPKSVDSYGFEEVVIPNFPTVSIDMYVDDNPTDLGKYGLDDPNLTFKAESLPDQQGNVLRMDYQFGDTYKEEDVEFIYFKPSDKNVIYGMRYNELLEKVVFDPFDLTDSLIYIVNILEVDQIIVSGMSEEYVLEMEREYNTVKKDDGKEEEEVTETFYLAGNVIEDEAFRDIYQLVIGLTADFDVREELDLSDSEKVTLQYNLADGTQKFVEYYTYPEDNNFYVTKMEEGLYYAVSADEVEFMFEMLNAVAEGEWPIEE
ncbi:DUF4340 domain-containing protein [Vallitalea okinawensis]|uniref:DUF4340 domain-containing protein n=1 Tax=Vallitalea okinawensis TaxID=2078660 RepID=UPI0013003CAB|nr:DUF4340 domain-containing protein [Vallitalea okinawensis]